MILAKYLDWVFDCALVLLGSMPLLHLDLQYLPFTALG
jgi:hypothetical protein